jgi:hypothetical protein
VLLESRQHLLQVSCERRLLHGGKKRLAHQCNERPIVDNRLGDVLAVEVGAAPGPQRVNDRLVALLSRRVVGRAVRLMPCFMKIRSNAAMNPL